MPYFDPFLTSFIQIYKTAEPFLWTYQLPEIKNDPEAKFTLTVDMSDIEEFATFEDGIIQIADLSDPSVLKGIFTVMITLADEIEVLKYRITIIIYEELSEKQLSDEIS